MEPGLTQQAIANRIEETFQVTIHRAGVGRALSAYRQQKRQTKPKTVQLSIEAESLSPVITENEDASALPIEPEETELPIHSCSAQEEEALIGRLTKGMDSRYGVALILNPFLQKLNLIPILEQSVLAQKDACADKVRTVASNLQELLNPERLYNLAQMYLTRVYLIVFRFPSIEAFKLADRKAFGQVDWGYESTRRKNPAALLGGGYRPGDIGRCCHETSPTVREAGYCPTRYPLLGWALCSLLR